MLRRRLIARLLAVVAALGTLAVAVPLASARPIIPLTSHAQPDTGTPVSHSGSGAGFDWGDAGIGAAGMLAVGIVAGGGMALVLRRRQSGHARAQT